MREWLVPGNLKIGSPGMNNPVRLHSGATFVTLLNGASFDPNGGSSTYGRLTVRGTGIISVDFANLAVGVGDGFTLSSSDVFGIVDNQTPNAITGTFSGIANGGTVPANLADGTYLGTFQVTYFGDITGAGISISGGNDIVLYNFQPVPEPASVLAICAGVAGMIGVARRARRRSE
jgi:hypothetical protein